MPHKNVGAGWTEQAFANLWNPTQSVAPRNNRLVEVMWNGQVCRGAYDATSLTWTNEHGVVMAGVTHWREIRE